MIFRPCDIHCHTERSDCAEDVTLDWYVRYARQHPDTIFAITDHSAQMFFPPDNMWGFWSEDAREVFESCRDEGNERIGRYIADIRAVQTRGMLLGIELDMFLDGTPVADESRLGEFDILLGAVHTYPSLRLRADAAKVIADYRLFVQRMMQWEIDVLAHPFRTLEDAGYTVSDDLIEWLVGIADEHDVALEINSHKQLLDTDVRMAQAAQRAEVRLATGTDSHRLEEFGDFSYHRKVAEEVGVPAHQLYWCPSELVLAAAK